DNTFSGPHNHGQFPIDVFLHSLTKFVSGHGVVLGGAIVANRSLIQTMRRDISELGPALDPHAAFLILRGLKTFPLRYARQCQTAMQVAEWLVKHPKVAKVSYPGLPKHPQYDLACKQQSDFGAVIAFDFKAADPRNAM